MTGSADSTPTTAPPISAGWTNRDSVVVLTTKMGDQFFTLQVSERVLELHQLDEQVVLRIQPGCMHRTLEVEGQPFLDPVHSRPLGQVHEQRDVENDRRRQDAVAAQEIDLQLHLVTEPAHQIDI